MNKIQACVLLSITLLIFATVYSKPVYAEDYGAYGQPFRIDASAYCYTGHPCADGSYPIEGVTIAGRPEWIGKACIVYSIKDDGSIGPMIGIYQIRDTGGYYIRTGQRIDIYMRKKSECRKWGVKHVYIQICDAEG